MKNKTTFKEFNLAKDFVKKLNLKNKQDWQRYASSGNRPIDIPFHPEKIYKNIGWKNFGDWVGYYPINSRSREYLSFEKAKEIVKTLNLKTQKEWLKFDSNKRIHLQLPASPTRVYRDKWISWGDWLGTNNVSNRYNEYLSFEDAKKLVHSLGLKGQHEYTEYVKEKGNKQKLPQSPERFYKDKGWVNTPNFLGYKSSKREIKDARFFYFYDLGNEVLGYGITYQIHKRNIEHKMQAKKVGVKINLICYFEFNDGVIAHKTEKYFRHNYPKNVIKIKGFTTENTNIEFLSEMIKFVELKQKSIYF